ncbi:GNAT family N-acetyltransferase [Microbulbifer sp. OS29]|uniref:GNAT family N-acetyltransferase n=1 Tax=Microbulbifer okhotskensis TaxID=2926617 RepID=A0A9X2J6I1_9GAMM|nr:GNAT family N-acetyltransferase [Microbulbifer okhotskensis]MCO1333496.1 GNAT family N-acetyltransferase [Microbulbifer okhotskensis]
MEIIQCDETYLCEVASIFDEYRVFCGQSSDIAGTEIFLRDLLCTQASTLLIAVEPKERQVMGFVNLYPCFSSLTLKRLWILNDLGVSSRFRGAGVSKALLRAALDFAKETKAIRVEFKTEKNNRRARQLYQSLGFEIDQGNIYYRVPC